MSKIIWKSQLYNANWFSFQSSYSMQLGRVSSLTIIRTSFNSRQHYFAVCRNFETRTCWLTIRINVVIRNTLLLFIYFSVWTFLEYQIFFSILRVTEIYFKCSTLFCVGLHSFIAWIYLQFNLKCRLLTLSLTV